MKIRPNTDSTPMMDREKNGSGITVPWAGRKWFAVWRTSKPPKADSYRYGAQPIAAMHSAPTPEAKRCTTGPRANLRRNHNSTAITTTVSAAIAVNRV